jgi:hypothetical protein
MTTAGSNITKANITASMETLKYYNSGIVWHSGNQPFQTDITGGDASGYATQSYANDISDTNVIANTIYTNFTNYAKLLSRIRNVRLLKWYQIQGEPRAQLNSDETQITNLNSNYETIFGLDWKPNANTTIVASDLDNFVNYLSSGISSNRAGGITIEEFYCHSNCHGSCHGSI